MMETDAHFLHSLLSIIGNTSVPNKINVFLLEIKPPFIRYIFYYYLYLLIFAACFFNFKLQLWQLICKEFFFPFLYVRS